MEFEKQSKSEKKRVKFQKKKQTPKTCGDCTKFKAIDKTDVGNCTFHKQLIKVTKHAVGCTNGTKK